MNLLFSTNIYIKIILLLVICFLIIILYVICNKIYLVKSIKGNLVAQQKGELINKTTFISKDFNKLVCKSRINKTEKIIIFACDFFQSLDMYNDFENELKKINVDYFMYELRDYNVEPQKRSIGCHIQDLNEIIDFFKERNDYKEIIMIGNGISSNLWLQLNSKNPFTKLILINYSNRDFYHDSSENIRILNGTIFSMNKLLKTSINNDNISNDVEFNKKVLQINLDKGFITIREYKQMNTLISRFLIYLRKNKSMLYFLNSANNPYLKPKNFSKKIKTSKNNLINVEIFKNSNHFLLNDSEKGNVFAKIKCIIECNKGE